MLISVIAAGCGKPDLKPVSIASGDICAFCKMAISEKRYAAEILDPDGQPVTFDEIGCMISFMKKRPEQQVAASFVTDYQTGQWIAVEKAFFVRSSNYATPMGSGIVAFSDGAKAGEQAAANKGELWTSGQFSQLRDRN